MSNENGGDLGRPQKLVLDVDQPFCGAERAHVRLEDGEDPPRHPIVDPFWDRTDDLQLLVAGGLRRHDGREHLADDLLPASAEVLCDVLDGRPFDPCARVVPTYGCARGMFRGVVAVAGLGGQVDAADEGDAVVDDDCLLVMAVQGPLLRIQCALHVRSIR